MAKLGSDSALEAFACCCTESEVRDYLKNVNERGRRRLTTHGHIAISRVLESNKEPNGVVRALLEQPEIQVNSGDHSGNTALHNAVVMQNKEVVGMLLARADLDPNVGNTREDTPLHLAAQPGASLEILDLLVSDRRVNVAALNRDNQSPLHAACKLKNRGPDPTQACHVVRELVNSAEAKLKSMSDFLQKTDVLGRNALHYAAESGLGGVVRELLQKTLNLALAHDNEGYQAVHLATKRGHFHVVELLLPFGRDREDTVQECLQAKCSLPQLCSVLHLYQELLNLTTRHNIAEFLLTTLYSRLDIEDKQSKSLFHWAVTAKDSRGHGASFIGHILKWRPEKSNEPLVDDNTMRTALHVATMEGNHDAVEALCRANNLDGTQLDASNNTALDYAFQNDKACQNDNNLIRRILLERRDVKEHLARTHKNRETYAVASNALLVVSVLVVTLTYAHCLTASEVKKRRDEGTLVTQFSLSHIAVLTKFAFFLSMASTILSAFAALPFSFGIFFVQTVDDRYVRRSLSRTRRLMVLASNLLMLALGAIVFAFVCSQYIAPYLNYRNCELACGIELGLFVVMSVVFLSTNVVMWYLKERRKRVRCPSVAV